MRYIVGYSPQAEAQLDSLYRYIADHSGEARAAGFVSAITASCEGLATFPKRGIDRKDIRPGVRLVGFRKSVTIAFEVGMTTVTILGVFYGGRNLDDFTSRL